jgi:glutamine amidotransferase
VAGLGILRGGILQMPTKDEAGNQYKIPQIGWNNLTFPNKGRLFKGIDEGAYVYFVHSYYLKAEDRSIVTATTDYSVKVDASVESGNVFACQFHPEKSADVGMQILKNFLEV